jgi:hypothetical protein
MNKQPFSRSRLAMVSAIALSAMPVPVSDYALTDPVGSLGGYPGPGKWGRSGVAAAKRAARKRRNQLRARA